ncbi:MAG: glycosyltransferase family 9 protein [Alphaproteobacteria bacterium]|nr:glycosyltransferase family 9 protein [Alphaproteobacteria bacterium]
MLRYHTDCRHFTGYKPCRFGRPCQDCPHHDPVGAEVLLVNLDALGDVLRTTALVPAIRRAWPGCRLTWITRPRAAALLADHPGVDRVLPLAPESLWEVEARRFDVLLQADKSAVAGALAARVRATDRRGFGIDGHGVIVPLTDDARELYDLGLDDHLKFRVNRKAETQLLCEALGLSWQRDPYTLVLPDGPAGPPVPVGFNTGCSPDYPYKKLDLDTQAAAIARLAADLGRPVLLLGGPEDADRNAALARRLGDAVEPTPVDGGLRAGAAQVARCDVVVSGDSLGMHMAIALQKHVVAWFGVTCPQEIDLYDRGVRLLADVGCAPCWRSRCDREPKCFTRVAPDWIVTAVHDCLAARREGRPLDETRGGGWGPG